jgi:glycosyltransferase involved in cell wall biosynthesis
VNVGIFMAERLRVPHVWQFRESLNQFSLSLSLALSLKLWEKKVNRRYVLISDYMMNYYRPYLPAERMTCIYNGVSLPAKAEREVKNILNGRLKVAIVGVVCKQKNQLELLQAQRILHEQGIEIDTYIIGTNKKEYLQQVEAYVQEHELSQYVHIMGHQDDVFAVLKEMNLGVVSATDEAFGRTTIEFMLMKMPVVVSDSGANAELVRDGVDGMVYPFGNVSALADAIRNYVENPKLLEEHGKTAYEHARENFSAEQNAEIIYKTINEIMR